MALRPPSKSALRALSRLCFTEQPQASKVSTPPFSGCRRFGSDAKNYPRRLIVQRSAVRNKTTLRAAPEPAEFANDPSRYNPQDTSIPEPRNQGTSDPQLEQASSLPDISNYYTLFPDTLPDGPPGPSTASNLPDSSAIVAESAQSAQRKPSFHINPRTLRAEFLRLQSQHHPDKYPAGTSVHQKAYALSTLLNNAYKTLSDPLLRAQYLLNMNYGIDVTNEDNSAHPTDQETLMEVMEAQEAVEDATAQEEVDALKEVNQERIRNTIAKVGEAFENNDAEAAKEECVRLKYWVSLQQGLDDWEPGKEVRLVH